jgi:hypothetical protein
MTIGRSMGLAAAGHQLQKHARPHPHLRGCDRPRRQPAAGHRSEGGRHHSTGTGQGAWRRSASGTRSTAKPSSARAPDCPTATSSGPPRSAGQHHALPLLANGMSGSVEIKGLDNKIVSAEVLGTAPSLEAPRGGQDQLEQGAGTGLHRCARGSRRPVDDGTEGEVGRAR